MSGTFLRRLATTTGLGVLLLQPLAHAQPPAVPVACAALPPPPASPPIAPPFDERLSSLHPRAKALLVTEISGLENLFASTQPGTPSRVQLIRRLAEDYVELENAALAEKTQAEAARDNLRGSDPGAASRQQGIAEQAGQTLLRARTKAVQDYALLATEAPDYAQLDEVYLYLGMEDEKGGDLSGARRSYYNLIAQRPSSKRIPLAYLKFGELFFQEAEGDPTKWTLAEQAYEKVTSYPPPQNKFQGYAWYKLGLAFWHMGSASEAAGAFRKALDAVTSFPLTPNASQLQTEATSDLATIRQMCPAIQGP
jgi:tetratricopeptide (TPR) repeat protein